MKTKIKKSVSLVNKTIVITGASKGLGKEIAILLSREKANVILIARTKELLEQTQMEIKNLSGKEPDIFLCDIANEKDVIRAAETIGKKFQRIDVLINNAGIGIPKLLENMTNEEMRRQFEVNFYGVFYCIKAMLPLLKLSNSGYILNISSLLSEMSFAMTSVYSATKFALSGFSEGLRLEMKKNNIKVGLLLPGPMNTAFQDNRGKNALKTPKILTLNPVKVAWIAQKMIIKRQNKIYIYRWILFVMRFKRLFLSNITKN